MSKYATLFNSNGSIPFIFATYWNINFHLIGLKFRYAYEFFVFMVSNKYLPLTPM